ncbi:MAG TPA: TRAP transporter large permease, partial [Ramlibacter sp.]|nr:TRAP transporter large permease [Ramlibacter sp.]
MALTILCLTFVAFLLMGMPVAIAIALSCLSAFWVEGFPLELAIQNMISGMNFFSFLAIPFFILSGEIMLHSGIAERIVRFARNLVGHWRGGLGMSNVVACTIFGGVSGSPTADVSAMGGVMIPMMKKEGYSADYAVNVTTHASLAGALMPTSHNMIIYAFAAASTSGTLVGPNIMSKGVSIGDLMFAGLLPVIVLMLCMLGAAYWVARKKGFPRHADGSTTLSRFPGWAAVWTSLLAAAPGMFVIVIILGCILMGVTTATEAAGIAVTYSLLLALVVYRSMSWQVLLIAAIKAAKTTG